MTDETKIKMRELLTLMADEATRGLRACGAAPDEGLLSEHFNRVERAVEQCRRVMAPVAPVATKKKR